jgi:hypothetical protein
LIAVIGCLVLAAIVAVLCFTPQGRALISAAGDALAVAVVELRDAEPDVMGETHVAQIGALASARDREITAKCRQVVRSETCAPVIPIVAASHWRAIQSSADQRWVM